MNFFKQYWWLILIIIVLIILIVKAKSKKAENNSNSVGNVITGIVNGGVTTIPSPSNIPTPPKTSGYQINDALYSLSSVNVYKSPSATTGNLDNYHLYGKDEYIGKYLATEGIWTKVNLANPARIGYVLTNQIYSK